jgi:hypothetical protein
MSQLSASTTKSASSQSALLNQQHMSRHSVILGGVKQ